MSDEILLVIELGLHFVSINIFKKFGRDRIKQFYVMSIIQNDDGKTDEQTDRRRNGRLHFLPSGSIKIILVKTLLVQSIFSV